MEARLIPLKLSFEKSFALSKRRSPKPARIPMGKRRRKRYGRGLGEIIKRKLVKEYQKKIIEFLELRFLVK